MEIETIIAVLLCVAVVGYVFFMKKDKKDFPKDPSDYRPPVNPDEEDEVKEK